jgi:type III secretion system low calcium response chaperone LcrH/SycD
MPTLEAADLSSLRADNPDFKYLLDHLVKDGGVLRDLRGITKEQMEAIYSVAYNLYRAGKHEEAEKVFRFLCFFDHLEKKFWMGLGASQQALKKYGPAIDAYSYASILDIHDPRPPLQAADCYIAMGNQEKAESALTAAIEFSGSQPQMKAFKERATTLLNLLKKTDTQSA